MITLQVSISASSYFLWWILFGPGDLPLYYYLLFQVRGCLGNLSLAANSWRCAVVQQQHTWLCNSLWSSLLWPPSYGDCSFQDLRNCFSVSSLLLNNLLMAWENWCAVFLHKSKPILTIKARDPTEHEILLLRCFLNVICMPSAEFHTMNTAFGENFAVFFVHIRMEDTLNADKVFM